MSSTFNNLDVLSPADRVLFNSFGRGPKIDIPFEYIHQAIEHFVDIQPDAIAAEHEGVTITYRQLETSANILANRLIKSGLQPRQRVCLVVQRSINMIVAILAVLKSGCQYIPLGKSQHILSLRLFKIVCSIIFPSCTRIPAPVPQREVCSQIVPS